MGLAQGTGVFITNEEFQRLQNLLARGKRKFVTTLDRATGQQKQQSLGLSNKQEIREFIKSLASKYNLDGSFRYAINQHRELVKILEE